MDNNTIQLDLFMTTPRIVTKTRNINDNFATTKVNVDVKIDKLADYQEWVDSTCTTRVKELELVYPALGLAGESGEVIERIKKIVRDGREVTFEDRQYLALELGDVLWYVCRMANVLDLSIEDIIQGNVEKIEDRRINGKK